MRSVLFFIFLIVFLFALTSPVSAVDTLIYPNPAPDNRSMRTSYTFGGLYNNNDCRNDNNGSTVVVSENSTYKYKGSEYCYWSAGGYGDGWGVARDSTNPAGNTTNSYAGQKITVPSNINRITSIYFDDVWVGNDTTVAGTQVGMNSKISVYNVSGNVARQASLLIGENLAADVPWTGGVTGNTSATFSPALQVTPGSVIYIELYSEDNLANRDGGIVVQVPVADKDNNNNQDSYSGGDAYFTLQGGRYALEEQADSDLAKVRVYGYYYVAPAAGSKTCSVSVSSNAVVSGSATTVSLSGNANRAGSETVRLFVEQQLGAQITSISPAASPSTCGSGKNCYNITSANCTTSNSYECRSTTSVTLPIGSYYFHCDLQTDPDKCSGNPFCSYEGGPITCGDWGSCSATDNAGFWVRTPPVTALSGRVTNSVTGAGISGVEINQGYDNNPGPPACLIGKTTTDSDGYFQFTNIPVGQAFCLRGPLTNPAGYTNPSTSYECQWAGGYWNPDACSPPDQDDRDLTADYTYNITYTPPTLGDLQINADSATGGVAGERYRVSGLRADEGGSNYYNALLITQNVNNGNLAALVGTAFTSKTSPPATGNNTLTELMRSSNYNNTENGFVLLYANQDKIYSGGPTPNPSGATGTSGCSTYNFCQGKYYIYFKGAWRLPRIANQSYNASELSVTVKGGGPSAPQFSVTLYKAIGNHKWGTYSYMMNQSGAETTTYVQTPSR